MFAVVDVFNCCCGTFSESDFLLFDCVVFDLLLLINSLSFIFEQDFLDLFLVMLLMLRLLLKLIFELRIALRYLDWGTC